VRIAVLFGGTSAERDISLVSGRAVALALEQRGHGVLLVDPAQGDRPVGPKAAEASASIGREPPVVQQERGSALEAVAGETVRRADVVFIALHGGTGEDGTIQGLLELAGKRYTGSGVLASALAMDKRAAKLLFREAGVPTPPWHVIRVQRDPGTRQRSGSPSFSIDPSPSEAHEAVERIGGYPVIVKPNDQGSTVGLTAVGGEEELAPAIDRAGDYGSHVLVERYIPGREITVAVLGDRALPAVEVIPKGGLYDYESKYTEGMSQYVCPADLPDELARACADHALSAFAALGCRDYARVDFRVSPAGEAFCLEVNTVPGMTAVSLVPMAAAAAGIGFGELVEQIVKMAVT
jgi:D-alanine-D-alanine ligase